MRIFDVEIGNHAAGETQPNKYLGTYCVRLFKIQIFGTDYGVGSCHLFWANSVAVVINHKPRTP
jgi:hypothetical protein